MVSAEHPAAYTPPVGMKSLERKLMMRPEASSVATPQQAVVNEARNLLEQLDLARSRHDDKGMLARIDFAIGATLHLRALSKEYDEAVGRGSA